MFKSNQSENCCSIFSVYGVLNLDSIGFFKAELMCGENVQTRLLLCKMHNFWRSGTNFFSLMCTTAHEKSACGTWAHEKKTFLCTLIIKIIKIFRRFGPGLLFYICSSARRKTLFSRWPCRWFSAGGVCPDLPITAGRIY